MKLRIIKKGKGKRKILKLIPVLLHNGVQYKKRNFVAKAVAEKAPVVLEKVKKARKTIKGRRVDDVVTSIIGWPPPGTKVTGAYTYLMPKSGEEPVVVKDRPFISPTQNPVGKNGKIVKSKKYTHLRDGIKISMGKGWREPGAFMKANARVTLHGNLVTNIYARDWDRAYMVLRENYGIELRPF